MSAFRTGSFSSARRVLSNPLLELLLEGRLEAAIVVVAQHSPDQIGKRVRRGIGPSYHESPGLDRDVSISQGPSLDRVRLSENLGENVGGGVGACRRLLAAVLDGGHALAHQGLVGVEVARAADDGKAFEHFVEPRERKRAERGDVGDLDLVEPGVRLFGSRHRVSRFSKVLFLPGWQDSNRAKGE